MISAIIITKNEEKHIRDCIESIRWVDEIIVVDSGSTDDTVAICKELNCSVTETDWPGFGPQKNRALKLANHEWILSIDADERIPEKLKYEIIAAIHEPAHDSYQIPRSSSYCGKFIKHSGWTPDHVLRLFRRSKARFSDDIVHEKVIADGTTGLLITPLVHHSFESLDQVLDKVNHYSSLGAKQMYRRGKRSSLGKAILKGFWAFIRTYILRLGVLDGHHGLMLAISNAEGTYYKYAKLALLTQQDIDKNDT